MASRNEPMDFSKFFRELFGLFLIFWAVFLLLSLLSFDANDPSVNVVKSGVVEIHNRAGMFGAYSAGFLNDIFGIGSLFWPFVFAFLGAAYISAKIYMRWWRWAGLFLLAICILILASAFDFTIGDLSGGGVIGNSFYYKSQHYLSPAGTWLLWIFITLAGLQLAGNFSWIQVFRSGWEKIAKNLPSGKSGISMPKYQALKTGAWNGVKSIAGNLKLIFRKKISGAFSAIKNMPLPPENISGTLENPVNHTPENKTPENNAPGNIISQTSAIPATSVLQETPAAPVVPAVSLLDTDLPLLEERAKPVAEFAPAAISPAESEMEVQGEAQSDDWNIEVDVEDATPLPQAENPRPIPERESVAPAILPSLELLQPAPARESAREDLHSKGDALIKCFADFKIHGALMRISPGPVVTMFEFKPDPGIRISKISNLGNDLSLALKALAVRIQAPIPGSDTVGIEIPNEKREVVNFRELAESEEFKNSKGPLTMILGKDISGHPYLADLAEMPHLLVAGATGAGKSVCLNSILVSMLYKCQPEDMRLLLIDPKRVEMAVYADLPHLVHPVVTDMNDAKNALEWATREMERRFEVMKQLGARNVTAYNQKLATLGSSRLEEYQNLEPIPYLVIVIDELADLMMTATREVETSIVRLAQLARAAGIHMILATQRPSVNIVTGLIKANIINRISFQVTSRIDSRTILDQGGAEYLLGRGDMLFKPKGGKLLRLHGPFLSDEEVQLVTNHWRAQRPPSYEVDFATWNPDASCAIASECEGGSDPLYDEARDFVVDQGRASITQLQRRFNIGFSRAGRLVDQMEKAGVIGPANGSKPRQVIQN